MFDVFYSGTRPGLFAHEREARDLEHAKQLSRTRYFWWINYLTDYTGFDFLWEPTPWQAHQRHAWPSQWQKDGGTYLVPRGGYAETNYRNEQILPRIQASWSGPKGFDYTWHPDPTDPPLIYQFGTQWQKTGGPCYRTPGAVDVKYMDHPRAIKTEVDPFWSTTNIEDGGTFDYTWHPDATDPPLIYQFGTQWQKTGGPCYRTPGAVDVKYVDCPRLTKKRIDPYWVIPDAGDVSTFDFTWHPDATDLPYTYQFGTQHQRTGGPLYLVPGSTDVKYVDQIIIKTKPQAKFVYVIDHLDHNAEYCVQGLPADLANRIVRYFDNYLDTLRRIAQDAKNRDLEYVWIVSSICDYNDFDWTWHPEQWQTTMLHVFASNEQKFGDTFFMHVPTFVYRSQDLELLEWYDLNYVQNSVPRRSMPVIQHNYDTHVDAIKNLEWAGPLALFTTVTAPRNLPTVPLWREKTRTIVPLDSGAESVILPRGAISYVTTQMYDYPYIDKTQRHTGSSLQDVIFISNGESMAETNWQHLKNTCPRAKRSDGVTGREAAYKAAAELSDTPWFYAVFAKTEVLIDFAFDYAPDRLQQPKHYIFHSRNPVNGLEYGAMNINLYNRQLVLDTVPGLDFTLSAAHEVIPICASISRFNTDPWITWRSAFREVLKLKREVDLGADVEIQHRLRVWTTQAQGQNAEHCLQGAQDAMAYYTKVSGRLEDLQLSFDWAWLQDYYYSLYHTQPWLESV